jgi:hypothetical protein
VEDSGDHATAANWEFRPRGCKSTWLTSTRDGNLDIVVGGKSGLYFFGNMTKGRNVPLTDVIDARGTDL